MNPFVIKKPVITEKSLELANSDNVYTFEVAKGVNKNQVKEAVERLYGVEVVDVNSVTRQPENKRTGRKRLAATTAKVKKAFVRLKKGQVIEIFDISEK